MTRAGALGGLFYRIYTGSSVYLGAPPAGRATIDVCTWHMPAQASGGKRGQLVKLQPTLRIKSGRKPP
jgi:hypothetical protein